jgi:hypothetical protein
LIAPELSNLTRQQDAAVKESMSDPEKRAAIEAAVLAQTFTWGHENPALNLKRRGGVE